MLRIAEERDIPAMLAIYAPYVENTTYTFEYDVPCLRTFTQRYYDITAQFPWLVWEEEGEILGYAYASPPYTRAAYRWCAEPSVYLKPAAHRRGIGSRLYAALEAILKEQGYQVLYALITQENTGSLAFHEKLGYSLRASFPNCGFKFNRWLGVIWMEKRISSVEIPSNFPRPWRHLGKSTQRVCDILSSLSLS